MENAFLELLMRAEQENWCTKALCTTCGALDYRNSLKEIEREIRIEAIANMDLRVLEHNVDWQMATNIALWELADGETMTRILDSWYQKYPNFPWLAHWIREHILGSYQGIRTEEDQAMISKWMTA
jgi:uncharacterized protein with HEPN domain